MVGSLPPLVIGMITLLNQTITCGRKAHVATGHHHLCIAKLSVTAYGSPGSIETHLELATAGGSFWRVGEVCQSHITCCTVHLSHGIVCKRMDIVKITLLRVLQFSTLTNGFCYFVNETSTININVCLNPGTVTKPSLTSSTVDRHDSLHRHPNILVFTQWKTGALKSYGTCII